MGGPAGDDGREIAAARARTSKRAIGKRGFIGEGGRLAPCRRRDKGGRAKRGDFLVAVDDDFIADRRRRWAAFHRLQRGQHDGKPALHVRPPGPRQNARPRPAMALERWCAGEHLITLPWDQLLEHRTARAKRLWGEGRGYE